MGNILTKPYTAKQKADFIVEHNHNKGLRIYETETALYALADYEVVQDGQIVDISGNPEYQSKKMAELRQIVENEITRKHIDYQNIAIPLEVTTVDKETGKESTGIYYFNCSDDTVNNLIKSYLGAIDGLCYSKLFDGQLYHNCYISEENFRNQIKDPIENRVRAGFEKKCEYQNRARLAKTVQELEELLENIVY